MKFLFIQDEYDHTHRAWHWIKELGIQVVFTTVPPKSIEKIYPTNHFPDTRFVNVLTGYVSEDPVLAGAIIPPSQRSLIIGYRGRALPIHYGLLGQEKAQIGKMVKW